LQGVRAIGAFNAIATFQSILQSAFDDVLTRRWHVSIDGIYKGSIVDQNEETVFVDIGNDTIGKLPKTEIHNAESRQVIVQVERKRMGAKHPILTTKLKIVGDLAILAQNCNCGVSLKIRDLNKRNELYALGKKLALEGWGIIWRTSSADKPKEILENEISKLIDRTANLNNEAASNVPALLLEGSYFMDVEFPSLSKKHLDQLRAAKVETLPNHHFYKSCSGQISSALEMAEKLLENGQDRNSVEKSFKEQILREFPIEGSTVEIEHVKPNGFIFYLGHAVIESIDETRVKYRRTIRSNGLYDGLGTIKEIGDKAVSETKLDEWSIATKYFSKDDVLKGTYININTPVEVCPDAIRYVDLEVDVCILPDGTAKVMDMEKLEQAFKKGFVSQKLFNRAKEIVQEILKKQG